MNKLAVILIAVSVIACAACSKRSAVDPTGLEPKMTKAQVVEVLGEPDDVKPAGENKEIYIYRSQNELISVFLINGKIKNIEHIPRRPVISR